MPSTSLCHYQKSYLTIFNNMAIPSGRYRFPYIYGKKAFLRTFLLAACVTAFMPCVSEASPLTQVPTNAEMKDMQTPHTPTPTSNATTKHLDCYLDSSNPDSLNSDFYGSSYCLPGEHMTSQDDPCPGSFPCCQCRIGTYLSQENICGTCFPHTKCDKVEIPGDGINDNVCVQAQSGKGDDVTRSLPSSDPPDDGTEEVDNGQDASTDTPPPRPPDSGTKQEEVDTPQDEENSNTSPPQRNLYKISLGSITGVLILLLVLFVPCCLVKKYPASNLTRVKDAVTKCTSKFCAANSATSTDGGQGPNRLNDALTGSNPESFVSTSRNPTNQESVINCQDIQLEVVSVAPEGHAPEAGAELDDLANTGGRHVGDGTPGEQVSLLHENLPVGTAGEQVRDS